MLTITQNGVLMGEPPGRSFITARNSSINQICLGDVEVISSQPMFQGQLELILFITTHGTHALHINYLSLAPQSPHSPSNAAPIASLISCDVALPPSPPRDCMALLSTVATLTCLGSASNRDMRADCRAKEGFAGEVEPEGFECMGGGRCLEEFDCCVEPSNERSTRLCLRGGSAWADALVGALGGMEEELDGPP